MVVWGSRSELLTAIRNVDSIWFCLTLWLNPYLLTLFWLPLLGKWYCTQHPKEFFAFSKVPVNFCHDPSQAKASLSEKMLAGCVFFGWFAGVEKNWVRNFGRRVFLMFFLMSNVWRVFRCQLKVLILTKNGVFFWDTLPETNIAPENGWLEY